MKNRFFFSISGKSKRTIHVRICMCLEVRALLFKVEFVNLCLTHGSLPDGGGGPQTIYIRTKCKKNFKNDNNNKKKKYDNEKKNQNRPNNHSNAKRVFKV